MATLPCSAPFPAATAGAPFLRRRSSLRIPLRCSFSGHSAAATPPISTSDADIAPPSSSVDCVVVGAGISGLGIAQALATKHTGVVGKVLVTEARERVGGNITTVERDGYLWEEGPNSFQPSDPILTLAV